MTRKATDRTRGRAWMAIRLQVLTREPLCRHCKAKGRVTAASEIDHIIPLHQGGTDDRSNLQPLCHDCHAVKTEGERVHFGKSKPDWLPKPRCRVVIIWGPPCGGKTTHAKAHAKPGDTIIDLDDIIHDLTGKHGHAFPVKDGDTIGAALAERNRRLARLPSHGTCWLILSAANADDRAWWKDKTGGELVECNPGKDACLERAEQRALSLAHRVAVERWFRAYTTRDSYRPAKRQEVLRAADW